MTIVINQGYHTWFQRIRQLWPQERVTRLRNLAWLMTGIYHSRSVHLSRIADKIPGRAQLLSITRRMGRFLDNPAVRVREWYAPVARCLLEGLAAQVRRLSPQGIPVGLVGDSEFGAVEVIRQMEAWHWTYVVRQKASHHVQLTAQTGWQAVG